MTVCLMKKKKAGSYGKTGMPIEFSINKYASYQEVVEAASAVLSVPTGSVKWSLFTPGGALIREEPSWSLIDYMRKVHKGIVKLGIGDVEVCVMLKNVVTNNYNLFRRTHTVRNL